MLRPTTVNHVISDNGYRKLQYLFEHPFFVEMADAIAVSWEMNFRFKHRMSLDEWIGTLSDDDLLNMGSDMAIFRDEAPA